MARWSILFVVAALAGCAPRAHPAPPLPPPPLPLPPESSESTRDPGSAGPDGSGAGAPWWGADAPPDPRAAPSLEAVFRSCRVLGERLDPRLSGRAVIAARVAGGGEVVWATPMRVENLPLRVVVCLVDRVKNTRFTARGDIVIPVDFTRLSAAPRQAPGSPRAPSAVPGTLQL